MTPARWWDGPITGYTKLVPFSKTQAVECKILMSGSQYSGELHFTPANAINDLGWIVGSVGYYYANRT